MFKKIMQTCAVALFATSLCFVQPKETEPIVNNEEAIVRVVKPRETAIAVKVNVDIVTSANDITDDTIDTEQLEPAEEFPLSDCEIDLIALVVMAEAEGESEEGKRLVIDTILNRVDSEYFPDTVEGVIYQPNQFSSMWNGRADRCYVTDEIRQLVKEELASRANYDVIFFTAGHYGEYGKHMFPVGNHYFSSY